MDALFQGVNPANCVVDDEPAESGESDNARKVLGGRGGVSWTSARIEPKPGEIAVSPGFLRFEGWKMSTHTTIEVEIQRSTQYPEDHVSCKERGTVLGFKADGGMALII